jgi:hypothetical protein
MAMTTSSSIKVKAALDRQLANFVLIRVSSFIWRSDNLAARSDSL